MQRYDSDAHFFKSGMVKDGFVRALHHRPHADFWRIRTDAHPDAATRTELDGTTAEESYSCMKQAAEDLDRFIDEQSQKSGVPPSSIALVGFSQGAGLCFENAPRRRARLAGVVAIAGRMKAKDTLIAESRSRLPFLVLTGAKDRLLDSAETEAAILSLSEAGIQVKHRIMADTGHAISDGGIAATLAFLTHVLA